MRSTARCWPYAPPPRWPCKCSAILPTTTATPATAPIRRCGRGRCAWWPRAASAKAACARAWCWRRCSVVHSASRCWRRRCPPLPPPNLRFGCCGCCWARRPLRRLSATPPAANPTAITAGAIFRCCCFSAGWACSAARGCKAGNCTLLRCCRPRRWGFGAAWCSISTICATSAAIWPPASAPSPRGSAFRRPSATTPRFWLCLCCCGGCGCRWLLMKPRKAA